MKAFDNFSKWLNGQTPIIQGGVIVICAILFFLATDEIMQTNKALSNEYQNRLNYKNPLISVIDNPELEEYLQAARDYLQNSDGYLFSASSEAQAKAIVDTWYRRLLDKTFYNNMTYDSDILEFDRYWMVNVTFRSNIPGYEGVTLLKELEQSQKSFNWSSLKLNENNLLLQLKVPVWKA